jgi:hypothetical protein
MHTRPAFGLVAAVLTVLVLASNVFADHRDLCTLDVTYQCSDGGGYDINPQEGYDQIEFYHIYAIHEYPEADSIVAQFQTQSPDFFGEEGTIPNQTLSFTVHDHWSFYDYYVLYVERCGLESTNHYYRTFAPGDTVLIQNSNTFDFYRDWGVANYWVGDFGRYCTPYMEDWGDGPQAYGMDFNWGTCDPELNAGPFLDVHLLGPKSMCVLWDDSSATNESYKLEVIRWKENESVWGDTIRYTLPGDYSGYCVNDLQAETYYSFQLYPLDADGNKGETRQCIHRTVSQSDIADTDLFHYLPYAPVSGYSSEGNLGAYAFVYGWDYGDDGSSFYHYLLIKREDGTFSVYTIHRGNDGFNVSDIEIVDNEIYVAHTQGDLWRVSLESDGTRLRSMGLDFQGGYPKQLEQSGDRLYMAIKRYDGAVPAAASLGKQNPPSLQQLGPQSGSSAVADLGIFDLNTETLTLELHTDPYLFGNGSDLISVGSDRVWLARNGEGGGGGYMSRVFAIDPDASGVSKYKWPLETAQSQAGIIDMKVNPVTGELVYLSPVYGFCGSFGTDYNSMLDLPGGMAHDDVGCFLFNPEGQLVVRDREGASTFYTSSTYDALVSDAPLEWDEYQTQPQTLMSGAGPFALLLTQNPPAELVIGGLLLAAGYLNMVQSQAMASQQVEPFKLGVLETPVKTDEVLEDLEVWREALRRISANKKLSDSGEDPGNHPFLKKLAIFTALFVLAKVAISARTEPQEDDAPEYDLALGKQKFMKADAVRETNQFISDLYAYSFIQPPDKMVVDYINYVSKFGILNIMKLHQLGEDGWGYDYENSEWANDILHLSDFYLYATLSKELHFLYKGVDLDGVLNREDEMIPYRKTITEWELVIIKNDPQLLDKLKCYEYSNDVVDVLHLVGQCSSCLDPDLIRDISHLYSSHHFEFGGGEPLSGMAGHRASIQNSSTDVLRMQVEIFSSIYQSYLSDPHLIVRTDPEASEWDPVQTNGSTSTFELDMNALGESGEFDLSGQFVAGDTVHSWLTYHLYQGDALNTEEYCVIDNEQSYFVPSSTCRGSASAFFYGEYLHQLSETPDQLTLYSSTLYLCADAAVSGQLFFALPGTGMTPGDGLTVYHSTQSGWQPLETTLDTGGEYVMAEVSGSGAYALFGPDYDPGPAVFNGNALPAGLLNGEGTLRTDLALGGDLPYSSPYTEEIFKGEGIPDSLADWIWLEVRSGPDSDPMLRTSALVSEHGVICDLYGNPGVELDVPAGSYTVVVGHRAHAPLCSPEAIDLVPGSVVHQDFAQNAMGYPRAAAVGHLPDNRHVMLPGDVNGDQVVNSADYVLWYNTQSPSGAERGYYFTDMNGDGYVDYGDFELWLQTARGDTLFAPPSQE